MNIDEITKELNEFNGKLNPCSVLQNYSVEQVEKKLGFKLPQQYVLLMKNVGAAQCGKIFLWSLKQSLGRHVAAFGNIKITCGPEYLCSLFVKRQCLLIATNDDGIYYFIKGLRKNAEDLGSSAVFACEIDVYDEYETEDASDLIDVSWQESDSLFEFVASRLT